MSTKYETPGAMPLPSPEYPYKSPFEEFVQSPSAPSYASLARTWECGPTYIKVVAANGHWVDKRAEWWDAKGVADVKPGAPVFRVEDRDMMDVLTYDLESGAITWSQFRTRLVPALFRGLISQTGSGAQEVSNKALWQMTQLVTARPTDDAETISRHERSKPDELLDQMAQLIAGQWPEGLEAD